MPKQKTAREQGFSGGRLILLGYGMVRLSLHYCWLVVWALNGENSRLVGFETQSEVLCIDLLGRQ